MERIRVSIGTASILGLQQCRLDAKPTTAYTMLYSQGRCSANCGFCAQSRSSTAKANQLSRVSWPDFPLRELLSKLEDQKFKSVFQRLCIQTLCYPQLEDDLDALTSIFRILNPALPLSLAIPPLSKSSLTQFYEMGVDRVAISLDAVSPDLFEAIKGSGVNGPFSWQDHMKALETAKTVFGANRTTTHLIIGLGETEEQAINCIQNLTNQGITIGLFPFIPVAGTIMQNSSRPPLASYRRIQIAYHLIRHHLSNIKEMVFDNGQLLEFGTSQEVLADIFETGHAFQTAGCPSCNRPFFTEQPGGPLYNYPTQPTTITLNEIREQLGGAL